MKTIGTYLLMTVMMVCLAWAFVTGWDRQEFVDQARHAERMNKMIVVETADTSDRTITMDSQGRMIFTHTFETQICVDGPDGMICVDIPWLYELLKKTK